MRVCVWGRERGERERKGEDERIPGERPIKRETDRERESTF